MIKLLFILFLLSGCDLLLDTAKQVINSDHCTDVGYSALECEDLINECEENNGTYTILPNPNFDPMNDNGRCCCVNDD